MPGEAFTFICGDDDYLLAERGRAWFDEAAKGVGDDLSKEVLDGRAGNVEEVADVVARFAGAVQTLSLFGERKVVWLRDVNFLADSQTGRAQGTQDKLEELKALLASVDPEAVSVLVTAQPVDKRRSFFKWCKQNAAFEELALGRDAAEAHRRRIEEQCAREGVTLVGEAVPVLIEKVGGNARLMAEEVRKLITYVGDSGEPIDERLVMELVPNFGEADFFEAADAFYSLDLGWTLEALRRHFFTESEARPLLANLQSRNRLMLQLRALGDAGALRLGGRGVSKGALESAARDYARYFGDSTEKTNLNVFTQNPWYLGRLAEPASKLTLRRLIDFQTEFVRAFEGIVERPKEQEDVCRELAVRCLG